MGDEADAMMEQGLEQELAAWYDTDPTPTIVDVAPTCNPFGAAAAPPTKKAKKGKAWKAISVNPFAVNEAPTKPLSDVEQIVALYKALHLADRLHVRELLHDCDAATRAELDRRKANKT